MPADYMMTGEEVRLQNLKRRRVIILGAALVILALAIVFAGRPALNAIKAWQARKHAQKAFAFIAQEKWTEARNEAVAAYQLRPTEPQALRAVARFLTRTRQPDALDFWKRLQDQQSLTREDRRDEATIALAVGDNQRADSAIRELVAANAQPADWLLAAQLSIQNGVPDDARASLEKVFNDPKASEREQFQAALLQLAASTNEDQVQNAWARIEKIGQGKSATALDALVLLARRALASQKSEVGSQTSDVRRQMSDVSELAQRLASHPLAKAPHKLLALDVRAARGYPLSDKGSQEEKQGREQRTDGRDVEAAVPAAKSKPAAGDTPATTPITREALIESAIEQFKDADADALAVLAAWLNGKEEYQKTLDIIPIAKAQQSRDLFLQHLDALGALGRWAEIKQLLDSDRYPLDQVVQKMYLARCNAQLGEKTSAENNWKRALEAATGDPGKLLSLADYAAKNGNLAVAESAYTAAAIESPKLRPAFQGRLRMAQASRDTKKIHDVLADMLRVWPNDPAVQNDEGYMRLLLLGSKSRNDEARNPNPETKGKNVEAAVSAAKSQQNAGDTPATTPGTEDSRTSDVRDRMSAGGTGSVPSGKEGADQKTEGVEAAVPAAESKSIAGDTPATTPITNNEELITIARLAEKLVERNPRSMPHRTLLALARLKQNRAAEALEVYSNIQVTPGALTPSALAVHAAVLAANGHSEDAKTEVKQIKREQLVPEELELLRAVTDGE